MGVKLNKDGSVEVTPPEWIAPPLRHLCPNAEAEINELKAIETDLRAQLTAAEKRASEAEAKCAGYRKVLHQISDKSQCNWARFVSGAELGKADARAQAVAEVLAVVSDEKARDTLSVGRIWVGVAWIERLMHAQAKLDAARKGE